MKLIYRGTTFNYDPANINAHRPVKPTFESAYELIYRGHTYRVEPTAIKQPSVKPTEYELMYRGITYQVKRNEQGEVISMTSCANYSKHKTSINPATQKATGEYSV
jgi:hypothetical protein